MLGLSGCGIPPIVTAVSFAVDGMNYASNGRSLTDHAISIGTGRNCALHRAFGGEPVCRDWGPGERDPEPVLVAGADAPYDFYGTLGDRPGADLYVLGPGYRSLRVSADALQAHTVRLDGVTSGATVFALYRGAGALEIYSHAPGDGGAGLKLLARIDGYADAPRASLGVEIAGSLSEIDDLAVSSRQAMREYGGTLDLSPTVSYE